MLTERDALEKEPELDEVLMRIVRNLLGRIEGPLTFRLVLQPLGAAVLAIRAGLADARSGNPAYLWTILTNRAERPQLKREGWKDVWKVFILAAIIDASYQMIVLGWIHPEEAVLVAFILACVPYLLIRGPANRIAAALRRTRSST